jgi:hypothetical protein
VAGIEATGGDQDSVASSTSHRFDLLRHDLTYGQCDLNIIMPEKQALNSLQTQRRLHRVSRSASPNNVNLRFASNIDLRLNMALTWRWYLIGSGSRELLRANTLNANARRNFEVSETS